MRIVKRVTVGSTQHPPRWIAALASASFGWAAVSGVRADDVFGPAAVAPQAHAFRIGRLRLTALRDASFTAPNDAGVFGVDAGAAAVSDLLRAASAPTDRVALSVNVLLVRSGKRWLLLDSGLGPKSHGGLVASLALAGVLPNQVTDVLITHTHADHIGGLLAADGRLAFPKAMIRMASAEWAWLQKRGPADLVKVIAPVVRTFEPGARLAPGVTSVPLDGHTPGHMGYEMVSGQSRLLDIGDLAHSSIVSLARPQWTMGFDNDAVVAKATRQAELAQLAKQGEWVFSPHFPFPGVGHVVVAGDAYAWKPGQPGRPGQPDAP